MFACCVTRLKGAVSPCNELRSEKRAWKIIISMKIAIAFDYIYQEIKLSEYLKLVGNAYALIDVMFIETM